MTAELGTSLMAAEHDSGAMIRTGAVCAWRSSQSASRPARSSAARPPPSMPRPLLATRPQYPRSALSGCVCMSQCTRCWCGHCVARPGAVPAFWSLSLQGAHPYRAVGMPQGRCPSAANPSKPLAGGRIRPRSHKTRRFDGRPGFFERCLRIDHPREAPRFTHPSPAVFQAFTPHACSALPCVRMIGPRGGESSIRWPLVLACARVCARGAGGALRRQALQARGRRAHAHARAGERVARRLAGACAHAPAASEVHRRSAHVAHASLRGVV